MKIFLKFTKEKSLNEFILYYLNTVLKNIISIYYNYYFHQKQILPLSISIIVYDIISIIFILLCSINKFIISANIKKFYQFYAFLRIFIYQVDIQFHLLIYISRLNFIVNLIFFYVRFLSFLVIPFFKYKTYKILLLDFHSHFLNLFNLQVFIPNNIQKF